MFLKLRELSGSIQPKEFRYKKNNFVIDISAGGDGDGS